MSTGKPLPPRAEINLAIIRAARVVKELREAVRELDRIALKHNRNERDARIYDQMCQRLRDHNLAVPPEWQSLCW